MAVSRSLRQRVIERSDNSCEYCQMPQEFDVAHFQLDHIRPQVHGGLDVADNLGWACFPCNNHKGTNLAGIDPDTDQMAPLYHPRHDAWHEHFEWQGPYLVGKTSNGRATVPVLRINDSIRVALRQQLIEEGVFPPTDK